MPAIRPEHLRRVELGVELRGFEDRHAETRPRETNDDAGQHVRRIVYAEVEAAEADRGDHHDGERQRRIREAMFRLQARRE